MVFRRILRFNLALTDEIVCLSRVNVYRELKEALQTWLHIFICDDYNLGGRSRSDRRRTQKRLTHQIRAWNATTWLRPCNLKESRVHSLSCEPRYQSRLPPSDLHTQLRDVSAPLSLFMISSNSAPVVGCWTVPSDPSRAVRKALDRTTLLWPTVCRSGADKVFSKTSGLM